MKDWRYTKSHRPCLFCKRVFERATRPRGVPFSHTCCSDECAANRAGAILRRQRDRSIRTMPEKALYALVAGAYPDAVQEQRFGRWVVDVYVPSVHMAFEADGDYWHRNSGAKDSARDAALRERFALPVVRFTEHELMSMPLRMAAGQA